MKIKNPFARRQFFLNRHFLVIIIICFFILPIIWQIISSGNNQALQKKAENQSSYNRNYQADKGQIFDRNGKFLASNILISKVNLSPLDMNITGFKNISSIWRISPKCKQLELKFRKKCVSKNLANQARNLVKNDKNKNEVLTKINILQALEEILKVKNNNLAKNIITKKKLGNRYYIVKKDLLFTSEIIQKLQKFKSEKFLICKTTQHVKRAKEKIKDFLFGWINPIQESKNKTTCKINIINGIAIQSKNKRFYPQAPSTTPLLGVINKKGEGVFGLEKSFNNILTGEKGHNKIKKINNSWNNYYKKDEKISKNGTDLHLTIDSRVQFYLFNAIASSVKKYRASSGAGIILNTNGEIIALTSYPTSNPNFGINGIDDYSHYLNRGLADNIDIASIIKPLIGMIALDKNVITMEKMINITKGEGVDKFKPEANKPFINLSEIIKTSHSLGSIKIGKLLTSETIFEYLSALQFGYPLGILPDIESSGLLRNFLFWSEADKKRVSFGGYGVINTTIAQIARAYLIFVNQGKIKNLKLLKNTPNQEWQIFKNKNINKIISAMENSVNKNGTGKKAKLKNFIAAGKTGTAQLLINGKYSNTHHNTLFVGFAPSKKAKYLMVVNIRDPKGRNHDGGSIAAPIFKEVMDKILQ